MIILINLPFVIFYEDILSDVTLAGMVFLLSSVPENPYVIPFPAKVWALPVIL